MSQIIQGSRLGQIGEGHDCRRIDDLDEGLKQLFADSLRGSLLNEVSETRDTVAVSLPLQSGGDAVDL